MPFSCRATSDYFSSELATLPVAQTLAGIQSPIGYYDISAGEATSFNYRIIFVNGKLTILPAGNDHLKAWSSSSAVLQVRVFTENAQNSLLTFYTSTGQQVMSMQIQLQAGINSSTLSVGNLAPGIYILKVDADTFKEAQRVKIK